MKAAVCDDDRLFLDEMKVRLEKENTVDEVYVFDKVGQFFAELENGLELDLVFMDLDWGKERKQTGLQFGERLYKIVPFLPVIFVTGYNDRFAQYVMLTEMNLIGYLTKPVRVSALRRYLEKAHKMRQQAGNLLLSKSGRKIAVPMQEIMYIESNDHKIIIHTDKESYITWGKLSELKSSLSAEFAQCHKSFLVNMNRISVIEPNRITIKNGMQIPISKTYRSKMKDTFFQYAGNRI